MIHELVYTSAPKGLRPGTQGFATVATTPGIPRKLTEALESLSSYRHLNGAGNAQADANPVVFSHLKLNLSGDRFHVISQIRDAGVDYTGRSNNLAHHVALEPSETVPAGPAWLMARPDFFVTEWEGPPRMLDADRRLPTGRPRPSICTAWEEATGDAGWSGVLAATAADPNVKQVAIVYRPGMEILPLLVEALNLLDERQRWNITFSTYFTKLPPGTDCKWRFVIDGTPESEAAGDAVVINLCSRLGPASGGELVDAARTGKAPAVTAEETLPCTPAVQPANVVSTPPARKKELSVEQPEAPPVVAPGADVNPQTTDPPSGRTTPPERTRRTNESEVGVRERPSRGSAAPQSRALMPIIAMILIGLTITAGAGFYVLGGRNNLAEDRSPSGGTNRDNGADLITNNNDQFAVSPPVRDNPARNRSQKRPSRPQLTEKDRKDFRAQLERLVELQRSGPPNLEEALENKKIYSDTASIFDRAQLLDEIAEQLKDYPEDLCKLSRELQNDAESNPDLADDDRYKEHQHMIESASKSLSDWGTLNDFYRSEIKNPEFAPFNDPFAKCQQIESVTLLPANDDELNKTRSLFPLHVLRPGQCTLTIDSEGVLPDGATFQVEQQPEKVHGLAWHVNLKNKDETALAGTFFVENNQLSFKWNHQETAVPGRFQLANAMLHIAAEPFHLKSNPRPVENKRVAIALRKPETITLDVNLQEPSKGEIHALVSERFQVLAPPNRQEVRLELNFPQFKSMPLYATEVEKGNHRLLLNSKMPQFSTLNLFKVRSGDVYIEIEGTLTVGETDWKIPQIDVGLAIRAMKEKAGNNEQISFAELKRSQDEEYSKTEAKAFKDREKYDFEIRALTDRIAEHKAQLKGIDTVLKAELQGANNKQPGKSLVEWRDELDTLEIDLAKLLNQMDAAKNNDDEASGLDQKKKNIIEKRNDLKDKYDELSAGVKSFAEVEFFKKKEDKLAGLQDEVRKLKDNDPKKAEKSKKIKHLTSIIKKLQTLPIDSLKADAEKLLNLLKERMKRKAKHAKEEKTKKDEHERLDHIVDAISKFDKEPQIMGDVRATLGGGRYLKLVEFKSVLRPQEEPKESTVSESRPESKSDSDIDPDIGTLLGRDQKPDNGGNERP